MDKETWRLIEQTYIKHRHCFIHGCSKKSLKNFIKRATLKDVSLAKIIKTLEEAENLGLILAKRDIGKCTKYEMTGKRL